MNEYRVLFILGPGRSGSTVVGEILGQFSHVANSGELMLWWLASRSNPSRRCGCGAAVADCDFWRAVNAHDPGLAQLDESLVAELYRARHYRSWPGLWWRSRGGRVARQPLADVMARLYDAVAAVSGASVIVDSSKSPGYFFLLSGSRVALRAVHLQRDPRSVVNSWREEKVDPLSPGDSLFAIHPLRSIWEWLAQSVATRGLIARRLADGNFTSFTYEEFARRPRCHIRRLADLAGIEADGDPFDDDTHVRIAPTHNIAGNPDRRGDERRTISLRESWTSELPTRWYFATTIACLPFLLAYRYRLTRTAPR